MRHIPAIIVMSSASVLLAACTASSASSPVAAQSPPASTQSCGAAMQAWLHAAGGAAFRSALTADSALRAALASGSQARVSKAAQELSSAARHAGSSTLPTCANGKSGYAVALADWVTGARDAMNDDLKQASAEIASGARKIEATTALDALSPTALRLLAQRVSIPAPAAPTAVPTTQAPVAPATTAPPASPAPVTTSAAPASCYPLSDEGTCYEPGEYCRDDDHGTSGVAGDGEAIVCEDNDGWRWEPS
jgi:hypothetical protein